MRLSAILAQNSVRAAVQHPKLCRGDRFAPKTTSWWPFCIQSSPGGRFASKTSPWRPFRDQSSFLAAVLRSKLFPGGHFAPKTQSWRPFCVQNIVLAAVLLPRLDPGGRFVIKTPLRRVGGGAFFFENRAADGRGAKLANKGRWRPQVEHVSEGLGAAPFSLKIGPQTAGVRSWPEKGSRDFKSLAFQKGWERLFSSRKSGRRRQECDVGQKGALEASSRALFRRLGRGRLFCVEESGSKVAGISRKRPSVAESCRNPTKASECGRQQPISRQSGR